MFKIILLFSILCFSNANAFWTVCSEGQPPNTMTSPSCSGSSCTVIRGGTLTGTINFTPQISASILNFYAILYHLGVETEIPISEANRNACNHLTPGCPTTAGTPTNWAINFPIPTNLPAVTAPITLELWFGISPVMCANITAVIV
ncbi:hypothetical protein PVAND_016034 [Polypedilum vanderplanki]|uniref:MD-2-related lipid-recognition domain-containing protein n=1 Tax=Polypedilum vanderplanki TaxID=319348 RepID=A0A9J6BEN5_POLVA|nr:hypothetical protein PVAND_016034 [Polypedilum vanderplanki]